MQMEQDFVASEQTITEIVRRELASTKSQPKQTKSKKPKAAKTAVSPAPGKQGRTKSKERRNSAWTSEAFEIKIAVARSLYS